MKHKNLKKAVEKYAVVHIAQNKWYGFYAQCENYIISWNIPWYLKEEQQVGLLKVHHVNDKDEIESDYSAGSFYDTIKSAIESFTYNLRNKKGE